MRGQARTPTDWPTIHFRVVASFEAGWAHPGPHAWDAFLTDDCEFVQPMLRNGRGRELWWDEASRLLTLLPDITGTVEHWSGAEDTLFIAVRFDATLGGRPFGWRAVDVLSLTPEGKVRRRESFFDSVPPATQLAVRPRAWLRWWRSGMAPLSGRRRLQRTKCQRWRSEVPQMVGRDATNGAAAQPFVAPGTAIRGTSSGQGGGLPGEVLDA